MIAKLQKQGYVDYTAYKGSRMTKKGRREAGRLMRYHALWEVFLVKCLHFSWSGAHELAEGLEHQTNEELCSSLMHIWESGRTARTCIRPSCGWQQERRHEPRPCRAGGGREDHVRRVMEDYSLMDYIQSKGIEIDMPVTVLEKEPYEGPILLETPKGNTSLSYKAAQQIFVDDEEEDE